MRQSCKARFSAYYPDSSLKVEVAVWTSACALGDSEPRDSEHPWRDFEFSLSLLLPLYPRTQHFHSSYRHRPTTEMLLSIIAVLALGAVATAEPDAISTPPFVKLVHDSYLVPVSNSKCLLKPNKVVIGGGAAPYNVVYEFSSSLDDWGLIHNLSEPGHVDWLAGWNLQQYVGEPFRFRVTDALGAVAFDTPHELREATDADECAEQ